MHSLARARAALELLSTWSGRSIAWLTLLMVLIQFLIVVLRYVFNWNSIALQESVTYLHAIVFMGAAAYTLRRDGHVRVDIFYREMGPEAQAWVNIAGTLFFLLPTCGVILWTSWDYVVESWRLMERSREAGGIPAVFLLKTLIVVMPIMVIVQGIAGVLASLLVIGGHRAEEG